jgi:uncharacterized membrane protein
MSRSAAIVPFACALALVLAAGCTAPDRQPTPESPGSAPATPAPGSDTPPPQGKRGPGQEGEPVLAYRVVGTEPFWGIRVDGDALHFTTMEDQVGKHLTGQHTLQADGIRYVGTDAGTAFELDIRRGECSDGMSDTQYAFTAAFRYGNTDYKGCAEAAK